MQLNPEMVVILKLEVKKNGAESAMVSTFVPYKISLYVTYTVNYIYDDVISSKQQRG